MSFPDLDEARQHHAALLELVIHHPGGWADRVSLGKVAQRCREAMSAVEDAQCLGHIEEVARYAADLYSEQAHRKWARGSTSGADFLRLEIVSALHLFSRRLAAIEARRRLRAQASVRAELQPYAAMWPSPLPSADFDA